MNKKILQAREKIVKKLNTLSLISVQKDADDSRITNISPTEAGLVLWEKVVSGFNVWNGKYAAPLTTAELKDSINVVNRLNDLINMEI